MSVLSVNLSRLEQSCSAAGMVMVEMAISTLLLVLIASGIIDYGRGLNEHAVMVDAARSAALAAATVSVPSSAGLSATAVSSHVSYVANKIAELELEDAGYDLSTYSISIRAVDVVPGTTATIEPGIKVSISRPAAGRFRLLPQSAFSSCVSVFMRATSGAAPEDLGPSPGC